MRSRVHSPVVMSNLARFLPLTIPWKQVLPVHTVAQGSTVQVYHALPCFHPVLVHATPVTVHASRVHRPWQAATTPTTKYPL